MRVADFLLKYDVSMSFTTAESRPGAADWCEGARHFKVVCTRGDQSYKFFYSCGRGIVDAWKKETEKPRGAFQPDPADVIDSLHLDWSCGLLSLEEFCSEFGYDDDDPRSFKKTKKIHASCVFAAKACERLFGDIGEDWEMLEAY